MKKSLLLGWILISSISYAQEFVLIKFNDKPSADTYLSNPTSMLTQKALDRRAKYNIAINESDAPVEQAYLDQIVNLGVEPVVVSRWFNGVFAELTPSQISQIQSLSFVAQIESFVKQTAPRVETHLPHHHKFEQLNTSNLDFNYGYTAEQINQLKLEYLHNLGFTGEGITIAVLDAGFPGVDYLDGFSYLRNQGKIKGGYNFVDDNTSFYQRGNHGTHVLSTIGGYLENQFVGTAIDADFYLFITEKVEEEIPHEEAWWIAGAERADYLGVDVINTSLGYSTFDDPRYDYTYQDMDGNTSFISRGANLAASKGMMLVNSAGNAGNDNWYYLVAPSDSNEVFTIGAVDMYGVPAGFSSHGPTADNRVKPDVAARGSQAIIIRNTGEIGVSSGTSFSSPIMAGAMACLVQAFPNNSLYDLRDKVRRSAHLYPATDTQMGYGIPDFSQVYDGLMEVVDIGLKDSIQIYPNPTNSVLTVVSSNKIQSLELINLAGKQFVKVSNQDRLDLSNLPIGIYLLKIQTVNGGLETKKVIKR